MAIFVIMSIVQFIVCWWLVREMIIMDLLSKREIDTCVFLILLSLVPFVGLVLTLLFAIVFITEYIKQCNFDFVDKFFMIKRSK